MAVLFQSILTAALVAVATLCGYIYWYLNNFDYWKKRNIPYCKPEAFFGNFKDRLLGRRSIADVWVDLYNELKDHKLGGVWMMKKPILVPRDPELIKRILIKNFSHFHDRGTGINEEINPLNAHLFNLTGARWRSLRVKLTPTFTSGKMKMMFPLMHECAREFVEYVKVEACGKDAVEFKEIFSKLTTDIIGTCAFGLQFNSMKNPDSEFRSMGRKLTSPSKAAAFGHLFSIIFPPIVKIVNIQLPQKDVSDFFMKAVQDTIRHREQNNIKRNDFLQLLIELKNKRKIEDDSHDTLINSKGLLQENDKDVELTDNLVAAQAFVFFLAGFETSSTTMSFALHELTINPDIQTKVREEIDQILEKHDGEISYDSIRDMQYLDKVINETLRKYPPVPTLLRKCNKDCHDEDTGVLIENGTSIEIPVYAIHHDPKYYPDPEKFDPERFSDEEKNKRPSCVFLPFGDGPRTCIGMRFGLLQTKLGLAMLLSQYKLSAIEHTAPYVLDSKTFIISLKGGVWARVTSRATKDSS